MEDGQGVLPDGTQYERQSGEELGENGYWYRWTRLRGVSQGGKVQLLLCSVLEWSIMHEARKQRACVQRAPERGGAGGKRLLVPLDPPSRSQPRWQGAALAFLYA